MEVLVNILLKFGFFKENKRSWCFYSFWDSKFKKIMLIHIYSSEIEGKYILLWKQPAKITNDYFLFWSCGSLIICTLLVLFFWFVLSNHMWYAVTVFAAKSSIYSDASGHYLLIIQVNLVHQIGGPLMNSWQKNSGPKLVNRDSLWSSYNCFKVDANWLYSQYESLWIEQHPSREVRGQL